MENRGAEIPWPSVFEQARLVRCLRILRVTLCLAESLLAAPLPGDVQDQLKDDPISRVLAEQLARAILTRRQPSRWLYLRMREGNRASVYGRYVASKLRWYLA
jgi:hypothetical protein